MTTRPTSRPGQPPARPPHRTATPVAALAAAPAPGRPPAAPTVRLRDPAGVVAAVPYLLGFVPRRSLVVVGIEDDQGVGPTMRTDLPAADLLGDGPPTVLPDAWAHVREVLSRHGCPRALVVLYGDTEPVDLTDEAAVRLLRLLGAAAVGDGDPGEAAPPPGPSARDAVGAEAVLGAPDVLDVLLVGPSRFRSLLCPDPACCPAEGTPVAATGSHPVAASFVLAGRSAAADRDHLEPVPEAASAADRDAALVAGRAGRTGRGREAVVEDHALLEEWLRCLPDGPSPELAGRLAARWRSRPRVRDACLAAFLPGGPALARLGLPPVDEDPDRSPAAVAVPSGGAGPRTSGTSVEADDPLSLAACLEDPGCATAARAGAPALRRLAALAPVPESADVLAAHAWLCWVSGEGTAAAVLAERAIEVDGGQSLAALVLRCLDHGLGAPWTHRPG